MNDRSGIESSDVEPRKATDNTSKQQSAQPESPVNSGSQPAAGSPGAGRLLNKVDAVIAKTLLDHDVMRRVFSKLSSHKEEQLRESAESQRIKLATIIALLLVVGAVIAALSLMPSSKLAGGTSPPPQPAKTTQQEVPKKQAVVTPHAAASVGASQNQRNVVDENDPVKKYMNRRKQILQEAEQQNQE